MIIYKLQNSINGKCYIGRTTNFKKRMSSHKRNKINDYLHNAIRKYGWDNFTKEIIYECECNTVDAYETMFQVLWMAHYTVDGYNIIKGGQEYRIVDEETCKRISESHIKRYENPEERKKTSESMIGMKFTNEHKKNISKSRQGIEPWNKGLTKETDERVRKQGIRNNG